ncbi:MAG: glucose-6-phosphate isomerase [Betaproteobacteria bacterium]
MNTTPPVDCRAWARIAAHAETWKHARIDELLAHDPGRATAMVAEGAGLKLDYSRQRLGGLTIGLLAQLLEERGFDQWRAALLEGAIVNLTENRAAWHTALRAGETAPDEVKAALAAMEKIGAGLPGIRRVVNLGIGGSDFGPRLAYGALRAQRIREARFVASPDPAALAGALEGAEPDSTLFVVVSKTFTTAETLANAEAAKRWGAKHFIAVSNNTDAARRFGAAEVLPMPEWVGGRYSLWSTAGFAAFAALGAERFGELLAGARDMDWHFASAPPQKNLPVLMALIGAWNVNFLDCGTHAVLPYAHALRLLPAHLQQLEMESNGKRVDHRGNELAYATAPVVWGAEGTPSQHSFHQLLHQGTQIVPADFIDPGVSALLSANARAQADALALGTADPSLPPHRQYPGNRPSSILSMPGLGARSLGALLAAWEHKVFTQGVLWNVNSFDQWGVELGKKLANDLLKGGR